MTLKNQHARLITYYIEQVKHMYDYAYQRCRQKHKIVKDFDTDEDFITDDEALGQEGFYKKVLKKGNVEAVTKRNAPKAFPNSLISDLFRSWLPSV